MKPCSLACSKQGEVQATRAATQQPGSLPTTLERLVHGRESKAGAHAKSCADGQQLTVSTSPGSQCRSRATPADTFAALPALLASHVPHSCAGPISQILPVPPPNGAEQHWSTTTKNLPLSACTWHVDLAPIQFAVRLGKASLRLAITPAHMRCVLLEVRHAGTLHAANPDEQG